VLSVLLGNSSQFIDRFIVATHFDESTFTVFRHAARELF